MSHPGSSTAPPVLRLCFSFSPVIKAKVLKFIVSVPTLLAMLGWRKAGLVPVADLATWDTYPRLHTLYGLGLAETSHAASLCPGEARSRAGKWAWTWGR